MKPPNSEPARITERYLPEKTSLALISVNKGMAVTDIDMLLNGNPPHSYCEELASASNTPEGTGLLSHPTANAGAGWQCIDLTYKS